MIQGQSVVVLASGGLDSSVALFYYASQGYGMYALSFDYGQRHQIELACAQLVLDALKSRYPLLPIEHEVLSLPRSRSLQTSSSTLLNAAKSMPHGYYTDASMQQTVVPFRNANLLIEAAKIAYARKASLVAYAAHKGDRAQYPDCRPEFVAAMTGLLRLSMPDLTFQLAAPFLFATKAEIVRIGALLDAPFSLTWSCYEGSQAGNDQHCGQCGTCVERAEAFLLAGITDPTRYQEDPTRYFPSFPRGEAV